MSRHMNLEGAETPTARMLERAGDTARRLRGGIGSKVVHRLTDGALTRILIEFPNREHRASWLAAHTLLFRLGLPQPAVLDSLDPAGLLIEDLGDTTLAEVAPEELRYLCRTSIAPQLARLSGAVATLPVLDPAVELADFAHLAQGYSNKARLVAFIERTILTLGADVPAHCDLTSANIHVHAGEAVFLDIQDVSLAPPGYDAVSLAYDETLAERMGFDERQELLSLLLGKRGASNEAGLLALALFRCLRVVGLFTRYELQGYPEAPAIGTRRKVFHRQSLEIIKRAAPWL
jgi:aminoglycoside/choline kinase family phosphotransferase